MGVGVAALLAVDEIEHHRAGIGCILEEAPGGFVRVGGVMAKGAAAGAGIEEGDVVEAVDSCRVTPGVTTVALVSDWVRGKEFSVVTLTLRKADGQRVSLRVVRQRVPGSKTELLGAIWQTSSVKQFEALTYDGKMQKLEELHRRGNLSRRELDVAKARLRENRPIPLPASKQTTSTDVWNALGEDASLAHRSIYKLVDDPEAERRRRGP